MGKKNSPGCKCCTTATPTTVSGMIKGCSNKFTIGAPGTVTITQDSDSSTLWSGSTDANGTYTTTVNLTADTPVTVTGTPNSSALAAASVSKTLVKGASNSATPQCTVVSGHCCILCAIPLPDNLQAYIEEIDETVALVWGALDNLSWFGRDSSSNGYRFVASTGDFNGTVPTPVSCDPPDLQVISAGVLIYHITA